MISDKRKGKKHRKQDRQSSETVAAQHWEAFNSYEEGIVDLKFKSPRVVRLALREAPDASIRRSATGAAFPAKYSDFSNHLITPFSHNLATELVWTCEVLGRFSREINEFLALKQSFDRALLSQEYAKAHEILDKAWDILGSSLWLANARLVLAEHKGGLKENRELLQSMTSGSDPAVVQIFALHFSQRAEKSLSNANYRKKIRATIRYHANNNKDSPNGATLYHFAFALDFSGVGNYDHNNLAYVLYRESLLPIIDRYANFVRVLSVLHATDTDTETKDLVRTCIMWSAERFHDSRITMLRHLHDAGFPITRTEISDSLLLGVDAYTSGKYQQAQDALRQAILKFPDCFEFYELYAAATLYLHQELGNPFSQQSIAADVLTATFDVLSKNDKTTDSLELLKKFAGSLDGMRFADQLLAFTLKHGNPKHRLNPDLFAASNSSAPSAKTSQQFTRRADALKYLRQLKKNYPGSTSARLFEAAHGEHVTADNLHGVPQSRWQNYRAYALKSSGNFVRAAELYENLLGRTDAVSPLRESAVLGLLECLLELGRFRECAQLIVDTYLDQKSLLNSVSLADLVNSYQETAASGVAEDICWPLVCYIHYAARGEKRKNENLYYSCEDFLNSAGVDRPSKLADKATTFDRRKLVLFLRHVCIPEVLDFSISYSNSSELEDERIAICQWLLLLDEKNAEVYSQDISQLTQAGMIRHAMLRLDKSKVHIDTKGIALSLDKSFRERFTRYIAYSKLNEELRASLELKGISFKEGQDVVVVSDDGLTQFGDLFDEVRNRFISSNEYGLDSYLSVRIRHGTLSGQIRSQFERENLITRRDRAEGVYAKNTHWTFTRYGDGVDADADQRLRGFSQQIDSIIERVKSRWIQIKGPANSGEGLFNFDYSSVHVTALYVSLIGVDEYDDFLQAIFSDLWRRTDDNLKIVVEQIRGGLREQLTAALDSMAEKVFALHPDIRHSTFGDAVTRCRTSIQNEIETIAAWFHAISEKTAPDFQFALLVETATEVVHRCFPTFQFSPVTIGSADVLFQGERFASFVDVLFILFENIVRHSRLDSSPSGDLRPKLSVAAGAGRLRLEVSNSLGPAVELSVLQDKIAELNKIKANTNSFKSIRSEGGSGYYKLHKLIQHDLGRGSDYSVNVHLAETGSFDVKIEIGLKGLLHEDPSDRG